jgi:hypothetical protein
VHLRTTLNIPEELLNEAQNLLGFKSKTDVIILSLTELIRKRKLEELKDQYSKKPVSVDLNKSRRKK